MLHVAAYITQMGLRCTANKGEDMPSCAGEQACSLQSGQKHCCSRCSTAQAAQSPYQFMLGSAPCLGANRCDAVIPACLKIHIQAPCISYDQVTLHSLPTVSNPGCRILLHSASLCMPDRRFSFSHWSGSNSMLIGSSSRQSHSGINCRVLDPLSLLPLRQNLAQRQKPARRARRAQSGNRNTSSLSRSTSSLMSWTR